MNDSLGGIITNGLLGNPIMGYFNLSLFNIIEIIVDLTGGHSSGTLYKSREDEYTRVFLRLTIFNKEYKEYYTFSKSKINIIIKFANFIKVLRDKIIKVKLKKSNIEGIRVKINEKD